MGLIGAIVANLTDRAAATTADVYDKVKDLQASVNSIVDDLGGLPRLPDLTAALPTVDGIAAAVIAALRAQLTDLVTGALTTMADGFFVSLGNFLTTHFGGPKAPELKAVEAEQIVKQIAEAVRDAEKTLNAQGLVISQGTVELDVFVKPVGGTEAGGRARLVFTITPRV